MDTTAAKSQAQSMRPSIVSFRMTTDCTAADDAGETVGERLPGSTPTGKERGGGGCRGRKSSRRRNRELQETGAPRSIELVPIAGPENWHE